MTLTPVLTSKTCKGCKETKPVEQFYKELRNRDGLQGKCRVCTDLRTKEWQRVNKDKVRQYQLKSKYGLSIDGYEQMLAKQGGKCAICSTKDPGKPKFSVDHCHTTGAVRGLLCDQCNTALGKFYDEIERLKSAIRYLEATQPSNT